MHEKEGPTTRPRPTKFTHVYTTGFFVYIYTGSLAYDGPSLEKEKNFGVSEWPKHRLLITF